MKDNNCNIDIVIPWVDGSDPEWQQEFRKYRSLAIRRDDNSEIRYRDWDNLQYLFRGIEKFAPRCARFISSPLGRSPSG